MQNEELLSSSSSVLDSIPDSESYPETDSLIGSSSLVGEETESQQGSDESAVTPVDTSSSVTVVLDQREVIEELQRIEGYNISILYTLYIALGLFFSVVIVKIIYHFIKFD